MTTAFQPSAFQNPQVYEHFGFQVDYTIPQGTVDRISIDASTQLLCDQWELGLTTSDVFRARARSNGVNIRIGLLDEDNDRQLVNHINSGKIDEWDVNFTPNRISGSMRGRDAAAYLLDTIIYISYMAGGAPPRLPEQTELPPGVRDVPGVTSRIYRWGVWRASTIIADLAQRCGLTVNYQAPDYVLREDVEVNGPALSAIQQLIQPFSYFEPYKVDVWVTGTTLNIRQRQGLVESPGPLGPEPGDLNTISVHDARITNLTIRARALDQIRLFRALGGPQGPCSSGPDLLEAYTDQTDIVQGGKALRVTVSGRRYRVLGLPYDEHKEVYDLDSFELLSRESTTYIVSPIEMDQNCRIINTPLELGSQTEVRGQIDTGEVNIVTGAPVMGFGPIQLKTVAKTYDTTNFLVAMTTTTQDRVDDKWKTTEVEVQRWANNNVKMFNHTTTRYTADESGELSVGDVSATQGGGHRPGGPGRGMGQSLFSTHAGPTPYKLAVIDNVPGAKDFSFQNNSMSQNDLNTIFDQATASSGVFEYEVQFTAANIPWIKKGQMLKLTNLHDESNRVFNLPDMLVVEARVEYDNSDVNNPQSLSQVRCAFWSKTWEPSVA